MRTKYLNYGQVPSKYRTLLDYTNEEVAGCLFRAALRETGQLQELLTAAAIRLTRTDGLPQFLVDSEWNLLWDSEAIQAAEKSMRDRGLI